MNTFFRIRLINVPSEFEDDITQIGFDHGATGVSEALAYSQPDLTYEADVLYTRHHNVDVFFSTKPNEEFFEKIKEIAPQIKWEIAEEENKDWLAEWKKEFKSFQLVGDYWIVPSWLEKPAEAVHSIKIDPGMAFGTGTHATTKMAAYFVNKLLHKKTNNEELSLIDVGTGTAILAILAKMQNVGYVTGIDIDPEARRVARDNCKLNDVTINIDDRQIDEIREQYDIVVANIIDGVLIRLKSDLLRLLKPGGDIFLTGILEEREQIFFEKFLDQCQLRVVRRITEDEWVGFWLKSSVE